MTLIPVSGFAKLRLYLPHWVRIEHCRVNDPHSCYKLQKYPLFLFLKIGGGDLFGLTNMPIFAPLSGAQHKWPEMLSYKKFFKYFKFEAVINIISCVRGKKIIEREGK